MTFSQFFGWSATRVIFWFYGDGCVTLIPPPGTVGAVGYPSGFSCNFTFSNFWIRVCGFTAVFSRTLGDPYLLFMWLLGRLGFCILICVYMFCSHCCVPLLSCTHTHTRPCPPGYRPWPGVWGYFVRIFGSGTPQPMVSGVTGPGPLS